MASPISTSTDSSLIADSSQQTPLGTSAAASSEKTSDLSPADLFNKLLENYQTAYLNWSQTVRHTQGSDLTHLLKAVKVAHKKWWNLLKSTPNSKRTSLRSLSN